MGVGGVGGGGGAAGKRSARHGASETRRWKFLKGRKQLKSHLERCVEDWGHVLLPLAFSGSPPPPMGIHTVYIAENIHEP